MFSRSVFTVIATILGGSGLASWLILGMLGRRSRTVYSPGSSWASPAAARRFPGRSPS